MRRVPLSPALILFGAMLLSPFAQAAGNHDEAPSSAGGPVLPRFGAVSDAFEMVGVLNGRQVTLYLDRAQNNEPVTDAQIDIQIGDARLKAEKHEDAFEVELPSAPAPGVLQVTATVSVGDETDLLAGEIDIHEDAPAAESHGGEWNRLVGLAAAAAMAALTLLWISRRMARSRQTRTGEIA